jgi:thioredoxin 1
VGLHARKTPIIEYTQRAAGALPHLSKLPIFIAQTMSDSIKHVSDASFESDVIKSGTPVLVDYWAAWCGPCKMIAPLLDDAAEQFKGRVTIAKLNVDDNPETAAKFGVRGIPTLMLFKDGKAVATKVGAMSKSQLNAFLEESV